MLDTLYLHLRTIQNGKFHKTNGVKWHVSLSTMSDAADK